MDQPRRRKIRAKTEETLNRDGHWEREFSSRSEIWLSLRTLGVGNGLPSCRHEIGAPPLQERGRRGLFIETVIDVKQDENYVRLTSWIKVGFWTRVAYGFFLKREVNPSPEGFKAIRARRQTCRELK